MVELYIHNVIEITCEIEQLSNSFVNRIHIKTKEGSHKIIVFNKNKEFLKVILKN